MSVGRGILSPGLPGVGRRVVVGKGDGRSLQRKEVCGFMYFYFHFIFKLVCKQFGPPCGDSQFDSCRNLRIVWNQT